MAFKSESLSMVEPEAWSWYRIVSESDCVYWYQATSMQEAHAQYDEEYLDPYDAGSHIHCSTVVTEEQVLKEKGNLEEGGE